MNGHTPGPWQIAPRSDADELWEIVSEYSERDGKKIANWIAEVDAQIDTVEMSEREQEEAMNEAGANARLITAAPDFYDAIKVILEGFEKGIFVRDTSKDDKPMWMLGCAVQLAALAKAQKAIAKAEGR